jgi:hypothetical protein
MSIFRGISEDDLSAIPHLLMPEVAVTTGGIISETNAFVMTYGCSLDLSNFVSDERPK